MEGYVWNLVNWKDVWVNQWGDGIRTVEEEWDDGNSEGEDGWGDWLIEDGWKWTGELGETSTWISQVKVNGINQTCKFIDIISDVWNIKTKMI